MKKSDRAGKTRLIKRLIIGAASILMLIILLVYFLAIRPAQKAVEEARKELEGELLDYIKEVRILDRADEQVDMVMSSPSGIRKMVPFRGDIYAATNGGLLKISAGSGSLSDSASVPEVLYPLSKPEEKRRGSAGSKTPLTDRSLHTAALFTIAQGLAQNNILDLLAWNDRLAILHPTGGISIYDGEKIIHYSFRNPRFNHISCGTIENDSLWLLTAKGDLIEGRGEQFRLKKRELLPDDRSVAVSLAKNGDTILVGTHKDGLLILRDDRLIKEKDNLFENRIINNITASKDGFYIATDNGMILRGIDTIYSRILDNLAISSLMLDGNGKPVVGDYFSNIYSTDEPNPDRPLISLDSSLGPITCITNHGPEASPVIAGSILAATENFVFRLAPNKSLYNIPITSMQTTLAANYITAIESDDRGRIWIGYFDRGIDILSRELALLVHLENDDIRIIRDLAFDLENAEMVAATSRGIIRIQYNYLYHTINSDQGLINNEASHISISPTEEIYCTAGGVSFKKGGLIRSIYAFHNLASNHTYCSAMRGSELFIATLGGLNALKDMKVSATYKTINSELPHNWVTALHVDRESNLWIGTYGGGVACLDKNNKWIDTDFKMKDIDINNNVIIEFDDIILAGTLSNGILIYDKSNSQWNRYNGKLPSLNVTAFLELSDSILVGTNSGLIKIAKDKLK